MKYLAIDPGKTTGYACFDENAEAINVGKIHDEDAFLDWMEGLSKDEQPTTVIIEQYRNRPGAVNTWSTGPTQRHIGAIERIARKWKVTVVYQEPSPTLSIGLRFLGLHNEFKGKHIPDEISALAHGTYYLRQKRIGKYS